MNYFVVSCFLISTALAFTFADDEIELVPNGKPFAGLKKGTKSEVIPKSVPGAPEARIIDGNYASEKQFPYHVGILVGYGTNVYTWCGGTLIGNEWVLTAAHCTSGAKTIEVRLGSINSERPLRVSWGYQNHIHEGWTKNGDDIALVKIQWVDFNVNMAPAALPAKNGVHSEYVNSKVVASGWGATNDNGARGDRLKYVLMTVMDKNACANVYGPNAKRPSILCTNTKGFGSTCSGDSGGPLVLENTRLVIGVVAFGAANACTKGYPAGFTRVTYYLDWIKQVSGISW